MAQSSKQAKQGGKKLTTTQKTALDKSVAEVTAHLAQYAAIWQALTGEQRNALLTHSPSLSTILDAVKPFFVR